MAETTVSTPWGGTVTVSHPQGASDDDIIAYAKQHAKSPAVMEDTVRSIAAAPRKAIEGMAGIPGMIGNAMQSGVNKAMDVVTGTPLTPEQQSQFPKLPDSDVIQQQTSKLLGPSYQPQTPQGQMAGAVTEGATGGLIGKGALIPKLLTGALSGAGSEVGGQMTSPDSMWHVPAQFMGGVIGGMGGIGTERGIRGVKNYSAGNTTGAQIGNITGDGAVSSGAVNRLGNAVADDALTPQGVMQTAGALGPEARMLDMGRQLEQLGVVGLSRIPGQAQSQILNAVEGRTGKLLPTGKYEPGAQSAVRLRQDFDTAMGPSTDMVKLQKDIHDTYHEPTQKAYKSIMGEFDDIGVPDAIKNRDAIQTAMGGAESLASNYGVTPKRGSLEYWDYVKKGLDRRINGLIKTGADSQGSADLGGLLQAKRDLVSYLDQATIDPKTGKSLYANARQLSATEKGMQEAAEFGPTMFNNRVLPEVAKQQFDDLSVAEKTVAKASIRRELERQMGGVGNDAAKAKSIFGQNNVLEKAGAIFGDDAANTIKSAVDRENAFQATTNKTGNSITNLARNVTDDLRDVPQNLQIPTAYGALTALPRMGAQYLHGMGMEKTRNDIARVLLQQHPEVGPSSFPKIIELLQGYNQKIAGNQARPMSEQARTIARALMATSAGQ